MIPRKLAALAETLADEVSTPFYVFDLDAVVEAFLAQRRAWEERFPRFRAAYSYKTNPLRGITQILRRHGASAEVVSGTELEWALADGFAGDAIVFDGPVKTEAELRLALRVGARIQIDSVEEAAALVRLRSEISRPPSISARLAVLYRDTLSRFGLTREEFDEAGRRLASAGLGFDGVHVHVGSNQIDPRIYARAVEHCGPYLKELVDRRASPAWLDVGGGFAARSHSPDVRPPRAEDYANVVFDALEGQRIKPASVELVIEPGRSLVEDHAVLATRVVVRKKREGRRVLVVDAGTNLVRSMRAWYHPVQLVRPTGAVSVPYDIHGSLCFESDEFAREHYGPRGVEVGDLVLVGEAGGYDIPSANVWTRPAPPILGTYEGRALELRRRQSSRAVRSLDVDIQDTRSGVREECVP